MLVLSRKPGEQIVIGDNIRITVVSIGPGRVKVGVEAPSNVRVDRAEIHEKKAAEPVAPVAERPVEQPRPARAPSTPPDVAVPTIVDRPTAFGTRMPGQLALDGTLPDAGPVRRVERRFSPPRKSR